MYSSAVLAKLYGIAEMETHFSNTGAYSAVGDELYSMYLIAIIFTTSRLSPERCRLHAIIHVA